MKILIIGLSIFFIISAIAPFSKREEWWIRAFDFPYLQFTVLGFICVFSWLAFFPLGQLDWIVFGTTIFLSVYRLAIIYPYTRFRRPTLPWSDGGERVSILSANVLMSNEDYEGFLKLQYETDPDILLLVEVDEKWSEKIDPNLSKKYPSKILHPLNNTYGMMLYSKFELVDSEVKFLVEDGVPSIHSKIRMPWGELIQFYGLHPKPPAPSENDLSTPRDAELVMVGKMAQKSKLPILVAGDMNDVAWSHTTRLFMRISGLLDPRMGRGFYNTFHAMRPLLRWPLDHIFLSHHFRVASIQRLNNFHSDHYPILMELTINPSTQAIISKEHADKRDLKEAKEKLEKVD